MRIISDAVQQHMDPAQAVRAHQDLCARKSLGIHWGTFQLSDEAPHDPPAELADAVLAAGLLPDQFATLPLGATWRLGGPKDGDPPPSRVAQHT